MFFSSVLCVLCICPSLIKHEQKKYVCICYSFRCYWSVFEDSQRWFGPVTAASPAFPHFMHSYPAATLYTQANQILNQLFAFLLNSDII